MRQWDLRAIRPQMQLQAGRAQAVIGAPDSHFSNATWTQSERPGKPSTGSGEPDIF